MDQAAAARHPLDTMEAQSDAVRGTEKPRRRPGPGGTDRWQPARPVAAQQQSRPEPRIPKRLSRRARVALPGPHQADLFAEPPCTDPYARWCGRGGAVRLPLSRFRALPKSGVAMPRARANSAARRRRWSSFDRRRPGARNEGAGCWRLGNREGPQDRPGVGLSVLEAG
jgi:hypothetical protein